MDIYKYKYLKYKSKYNQENQKPIKAIAFFDGIIKGTVLFEELINSNIVKIKINLFGFEPLSKHGFHVHESGDLSKGCKSLCAHLNPYKKSHGDRNDEERHVGDLGNIIADQFGIVDYEFTDHLIKLRGLESNIIGRGLVIHAHEDDCGKTNHILSKTTGNSGDRMACSIIGYSSFCDIIKN